MQILTLEEAKSYMRVDFPDDDDLIASLIGTAEKLCLDIARMDEDKFIECGEIAKAAVNYAAAFLYEHREQADHHELKLTLRSLLSDLREAEF